jgi:hypothetical protein
MSKEENKTGKIKLQWVNLLSLLFSYLGSQSVIIFYAKTILKRIPNVASTITLNDSIYLIPSFVGGLGALIGLLGDFIGVSVQNICKLKVDSMTGQRIHWFFTGTFWIFGIAFSLLYFSGVSYKAVEQGVSASMLLTSIVAGLIIGISAPLLDKKYYGKPGGGFPADAKVKSSIMWFTWLGAIFGICSSTVILFSLTHQVSTISAILFIVISTILSVFYGIFAGSSAFNVGGLGRLVIKEGRLGLMGSMLGIMVGILCAIIAIILIPKVRTIHMVWNLALLGASMGAIFGTFYPKSLKSIVELIIFGPESESFAAFITPMMKTVYIAAIAIPWGILIAFGAIISGVSQ